MSLAPKCFAPKCILLQNVSRQSVPGTKVYPAPKCLGSKMFHTQVYPAPKCLGAQVSLAPKCLRPTVPGDKVDWLLNVLAPK